MTHPLTERQQQVLDYLRDHTVMQTSEQFGITKSAIRWILEKQSRLEEEQKEEGKQAGFLPVVLKQERKEEPGELLRVRVSGIEMEISADDLARVMRRLHDDRP